MNYKFKIIIYILFLTLTFSSEEKAEKNESTVGVNRFGSFGLVGQYGTLPNPVNDRAKGYLLKGKAQTAITNYGNFINLKSVIIIHHSHLSLDFQKNLVRKEYLMKCHWTLKVLISVFDFLKI